MRKPSPWILNRVPNMLPNWLLNVSQGCVIFKSIWILKITDNLPGKSKKKELTELTNSYIFEPYSRMLNRTKGRLLIVRFFSDPLPPNLIKNSPCTPSPSHPPWIINFMNTGKRPFTFSGYPLLFLKMGFLNKEN